MVGPLRSLLRAAVEGPETTRLRRFVTVGTAAAGVQTGLLAAFVEVGGLQYLLAAAVAIEITIVLQFVANNAWTFRRHRHATRAEYLRGLVQTNLVRGSAIPLQLAVLFALVRFVSVPYLPANLVAIGVSGIYRYALDSRWTWGVRRRRAGGD